MVETSHKEVNKKLQDEVTRCAKDFYYFCPTYLRIVDKNGRLVPLELNAVQRRFLSELETNPWV